MFHAVNPVTYFRRKRDLERALEYKTERQRERGANERERLGEVV